MALWLLAGCAGTPQTRALLDASSGEKDRRFELSSVPFHPQQRWQCGPAALATVLQWSGAEVTPDALVSEVYVPARRGSLQPEMLATTRRHGRVPYVLEPGLEVLITEIEAGQPVLVLQNLGLSWMPRWHYAVVIGFDLDREELILRSGTTERQRMSLTLFERTWRRGDHWAVVVTEPDRIPVTAAELDWLRTVVAFEQAGVHDTAMIAYESTIERWPDSRGAWMGIGNIHYRKGDHEAAAQAFSSLLGFHPDFPAAQNNLARTLMKLGRSEEAKILAARAVAAEPDNPVYVRTLEAARDQ